METTRPILSTDSMASTSPSTGSETLSKGAVSENSGPSSGEDITVKAPSKDSSRAALKDEAWAKYLPTLRRLYVDEGKTLKQVMVFMETEHNFKTSYDDSNS